MNNDEQLLRQLYENWIKATTEGNLELAKSCIADDAVFIVPVHGQMDKETFAQGAAGVSPEDSPFVFDLKSDLKEIKIFGDHAYMLIESDLKMTPKAGGDTTRMSGFSLSVLEKRDGTWRIQRDANTLTVVPESP